MNKYYQVIQALTLFDMAKDVDDAIKHGFTPTGGIVVIKDGDKEWFSQAVFKHKQTA